MIPDLIASCPQLVLNWVPKEEVGNMGGGPTLIILGKKCKASQKRESLVLAGVAQ